jgi:hypothetical protein
MLLQGLLYLLSYYIYGIRKTPAAQPALADHMAHASPIYGLPYGYNCTSTHGHVAARPSMAMSDLPQLALAGHVTYAAIAIALLIYGEQGLAVMETRVDQHRKGMLALEDPDLPWSRPPW